jgi:toxin YoeB
MSYQLIITLQAKRDFELHKKAGNKLLLKKIAALLDELTEHPFTGTGKPEPLKFDLAGYWSRRINKEHRLIYEVIEPDVIVVSALGHYE